MSIEKIHKLGYFAYKRKIPLVPLICKFLIRLIFNSAVDPSTEIGKGTKFAYGGIGVVVHKKAVIGKNVMIGSGVTIGGRRTGVPIIGNNVNICTGAKVVGGLKIGDNSIVAPNAVVINDVPENVIVVGIPATIKKVINQNNGNQIDNV